MIRSFAEVDCRGKQVVLRLRRNWLTRSSSSVLLPVILLRPGFRLEVGWLAAASNSGG